MSKRNQFKDMDELIEILREIDEMYEADMGCDRHTGELISEARSLAKQSYDKAIRDYDGSLHQDQRSA